MVDEDKFYQFLLKLQINKFFSKIYNNGNKLSTLILFYKKDSIPYELFRKINSNP